MDVGSSAKPAIGASQAAVARPEPVASYRAVRTVLPPQASVQQAPRVEPVRFEPSANLASRAALDAAMRAALRRETVIDDRTRAVVTQTVEEATGEIVAQTPDEAILKLRAYLREASGPEPSAPSGRVSKTA